MGGSTVNKGSFFPAPIFPRHQFEGRHEIGGEDEELLLHMRYTHRNTYTQERYRSYAFSCFPGTQGGDSVIKEEAPFFVRINNQDERLSYTVPAGRLQHSTNLRRLCSASAVALPPHCLQSDATCIALLATISAPLPRSSCTTSLWPRSDAISSALSASKFAPVSSSSCTALT